MSKKIIASKKAVVKKKVKAPVKKIIKKAVVKKAVPKKKAAKVVPASRKNLAKKVSKKPAPKKASAPLKTSKTKKPQVSSVKKTSDVKKAPARKPLTKAPVINRGVLRQTFVTKPKHRKEIKLSPFFAKQRERLLLLKDTLLDSMQGVARDNLHAGSDTSAFGMHQADAGSDAYDRDFALSILSQEQNSLYEIDEALKRIDDGTYGVCEVSNKPIPRARLEARPFTRFTVECQAELEKRQHFSGARLPVSSLFGLTEEETENEDEENIIENTKD